MPPIFRNVLAVIAGLVAGSAVNMAIVMVGPMVIPPPEGVDMSDMDRLAENLKLLRPANFVPPLLAHAVGTLIGAFITAKIAVSHRMMLAMLIGAFFLLGGIAMVKMVGGPGWFIATDLIGAYLPMGYLGGLLGAVGKNSQAL
jgi:hypothetical protein